MRTRIVVAALIASTTFAFQNAGATGTAMNAGTITTGVAPAFQQALGANTRTACGVQNTGTHAMYVEVSSSGTAPTTTTAAFVLAPGQLYSCSGAAVAGEYVYISGTSGDAYVTSETL